MTFKITIGGTSFNLVVSSPELITSLVSTKFLSKKGSIDRDAIIELNEFTGTLYITHANDSTNEQEESNEFLKNIAAERVSAPSRENSDTTYVAGRFESFKSTVDNNLVENVTDHTKEKIQLPRNSSLEASNFFNGGNKSDYLNYSSELANENEFIVENNLRRNESSKLANNHNNSILTYVPLKSSSKPIPELQALYDEEFQDEAPITKEIRQNTNPSFQRRSTVAASNITEIKAKLKEKKFIANNKNISFKSDQSLCEHEVNDEFQSQHQNLEKEDENSPDDKIRMTIDVTKTQDDSSITSSSIDDSATTSSKNRSLPSHDSDFSFSYASIALPSEADIDKTLSISRNKKRIETRLHLLCQDPKATFQDLKHLLKFSPADARCFDEKGRLPLHLIAQNSHFIFERKSEEIQGFIEMLIKEFPEAILIPDDKGYIPFTIAIAEWIQEAHSSCRRVKSSRMLYSEIEDEGEENKIPVVIYSDPLVEWSFKMLGQIFIRMESSNQRLELNSIRRFDSPTNQFLDKISSIHLLFKTCLLINDDALRFRIFGLPFMKRCFLKKHAVGNWIVTLLADTTTCTRAIEFLEDLSCLTTRMAFGIKAKPRASDVALFRNMQDDIIKHLCKMENILKAFFLLDEESKKRACLCYAVQRILEQSMVNPSLIGLLVFDICMNVLLLAAYSEQVSIVLYETDAFFGIRIRDSPSIMTTLICIYLFFREDVSEFLILKSFKKVMQRYLDGWQLIEFISILIVLATNIHIIFIPGNTPYWVLGITKIFVWLRLISFLKRINVNLSMFVRSIGKILTSLLWFLVVLIISMFMYADILHLALRSRPGFCEEQEEMSLFADYCSDHLMFGVLRAYSIIVGGDGGLEEYRDLSVVWFFYTFFGMIILLNILIAIVTDAYEKTNTAKYSHLGQARIPLLAKHDHLEKTAKNLCEKGGIRLSIALAGVVLFVTLFFLSYAALLNAVTSFDYGSEAGRIVAGVLQSILCFVAVISLSVAVSYLFNISIFGNRQPPKFVQNTKRVVGKIMDFLVKENLEPVMEDELDEKNFIPDVKEMMDMFESRISSDMRGLSVR